ncbi:hypothetical protein [Acinetobacter sp.]|uniref:hypothetical protein n=1 Tax=Acinetobacter sp. TaxID=472 RepID=UPI0038901566
MLLIAMIGREDLGKGTLFNKTDGGEGTAGRVVKPEEVEKRLATFAKKSTEEWADINSRIQQARSKTTSNPAWQKFHAQQVAEAKSQRCTVDGITIYERRKKLIEALGQSKTGSRSPKFRYV